MERHLNIIAFNIPWPANYGGIIDVYYKMKALHQCGVKIILHCFEYERAHSPELEAICEKVFYYKRHTGLCANMTLLPYNVYSRKHPELIANLLKNDYPILFEGLHCCYYINDPRLQNRKKIYREANIEHDYYYHLAQAESHPIRKTFFRIEAWRFKHYQKNTETCRPDNCRFKRPNARTTSDASSPTSRSSSCLVSIPTTKLQSSRVLPILYSITVNYP